MCSIRHSEIWASIYLSTYLSILKYKYLCSRAYHSTQRDQQHLQQRYFHYAYHIGQRSTSNQFTLQTFVLITNWFKLITSIYVYTLVTFNFWTVSRMANFALIISSLAKNFHFIFMIVTRRCQQCPYYYRQFKKTIHNFIALTHFLDFLYINKLTKFLSCSLTYSYLFWCPLEIYGFFLLHVLILQNYWITLSINPICRWINLICLT